MPCFVFRTGRAFCAQWAQGLLLLGKHLVLFRTWTVLGGGVVHAQFFVRGIFVQHWKCPFCPTLCSEQWWKHSWLINLLLQLSCSCEGDGELRTREGRWHLETLGRESRSACTLKKASCQEYKKYIWVALNQAVEMFLIFEVSSA